VISDFGGNGVNLTGNVHPFIFTNSRLIGCNKDLTRFCMTNAGQSARSSFPYIMGWRGNTWS
jgi:hypothetical protein